LCRCVFRLVDHDVSAVRGVATSLIVHIGCYLPNPKNARVMSMAPLAMVANVFAALGSGILRHLRGLTASTRAYTSRRNPITWRRHSGAGLLFPKHPHAKAGVVSQVMELNESRRTPQVVSPPRYLFVAAALAAIDRCVGRPFRAASVGVREFRLNASVASGMTKQIARLFVSMVGPVRDWLVTATLTSSNGTHTSMLHLNDAIGG
jgi:hypothetical protein